jgi:hypothetical protein
MPDSRLSESSRPGCSPGCPARAPTGTTTGGSAGAFLTVRGTLTEQQAVVRPDAPPRIVPGSRDLPVGALRPFGTKHLHKVTNNALEPAVSLHVYAPALVEMNAYQVVDGDQLRLTESQLVGRNW